MVKSPLHLIPVALMLGLMLSACGSGSATVAVSGSISGTVKNNSGRPVSNAQVVATQGLTTVASSVTDSNGTFTISTVTAGTYALVVNNAWTNTSGSAQTAVNADTTTSVTVPSVTVTAGQTTNVNITD